MPHRDWFKLVIGGEVDPEGFGHVVQWIVTFFYMDNGILVSPWTARLQVDLDVLVGLFNWVGLQTNINKTVGMVFQPFQILDGHLEAA